MLGLCSCWYRHGHHLGCCHCLRSCPSRRCQRPPRLALVSRSLQILKSFTNCFAIRGYIVFGVATVGIGILTFFFLVDDTHHRLLRLTEKEKEIVEERSKDNCVVRNKEIKKEQIWEAVKEPRLWILFVVFLLNSLQNGGLTTFSTLLVKGLGFSVSQCRCNSTLR